MLGMFSLKCNKREFRRFLFLDLKMMLGGIEMTAGVDFFKKKLQTEIMSIDKT